MKIAVSSYSFAQAMRAGKMTMLDVIPKAKEFGFAGVEIVPTTETPEEMKKIAPELVRQSKESGVEIIAYLVGSDFIRNGLDAEVERLKEHVEIAEMLGAPRMRHDAAFGQDAQGNPVEWSDALPVLAEGYRRVTEYAQSHGVKTMIENHGVFAQNSWRVKALIEKVNHPNFGWLCDIGNFICADEDPVHGVTVAADYAVHAHVKDFHLRAASRPQPLSGWHNTKSGGTYRRGAIIGHGDVAVEKCLKILKDKGYDGWLSIEFEGMEDCFMAICEGRDNVVRYLQELV